MKKWVWVALTFLSYQSAEALPLSNPNEASLYTEGLGWIHKSLKQCSPCFCGLDCFDLRLGFYGDYVFNRNLQVNNSESNTNSCIQTTTLFTNAGSITLNLADWLDIYGLVGQTHLGILSNSSVFTTNPTSQFTTLLDFNSCLAWSLGGRVTLWECRCFGIGLEGQYLYTKPTLNSSTTQQSVVYFNSSNQTLYSEWQIGIGASYRFITRDSGVVFVPYVGVKWAVANLNLESISYTQSGASFFLPNLQSSKLWGCAAGATLTMNKTLGLTVEGRWADESAVYVSGQVSF